MHNIFSEPFSLLKNIKNVKKNGMSLVMRLFSFFCFFLISVILGMIIILMLTGTFNRGRKESEIWLKNELNHLNQSVYEDLGRLSLKGISLSEKISLSIEKILKEKNIQTLDFKNHPEVLNKLLSEQTERLLSELKSSGTSGAFIILDATVNPILPDSKNSRAGIFLKSTEPNIAKSVDANVRFLRGPANVAREHSLELLPQWKMEFKVNDEDFFYTTKETAEKFPNLPLSRLYYWSNRILLTDNSESGMLLCIPLISESGTIFGICGFELSSMGFKTSYSPDNSIYPRVFSTLSPVENNKLDISSGLVGGNYYQTNLPVGIKTSIQNYENDFYTYVTEDNKTYKGSHKKISLYPSDSPFADTLWVTSVIMPKDDLYNVATATNKKLYISFGFLLIVSLAVAAFISQRYIRPVLEALNIVKTKDRKELPKTKILEIDDLFEFLALQDNDVKLKNTNLKSSHESKKDISGDFSSYIEFVERIKTLSPAEKSVFNLYTLGHTATEIAEILCLSINTIKTHNKRIYMKLNVSSRKELMVYVQMMKKTDEKKETDHDTFHWRKN